ncbi:hypothetical protein CF319_g7240 [Tilletia indica]|nr:hypothetical protein CF319_g7240 [Tilletia indica]
MQNILVNDFADVKGCFHLAVDVWTSANGFAFLGLIICYQQSGKAVRRLLEMIPFLTQHDGEHLASATFKVLDKYNIAGRLWNVVSDNASENNTMMKLLASMDGLPRFDTTKEMSCRVRCTAHVLNLISKAVLKSFYSRRSKRGGDGAAEEHNTADEDWDVEVEQDDTNDDEDDGEELSSSAGCEVDGDMALEDEDDFDISTALNPELTAVASDDADIEAALHNETDDVQTARQRKELQMRNNEVGLALRKLAWLAVTLRYSPTKRARFHDVCQRLGLETPHSLIRDVATRWDSTFKMLERSLDLWPAIIAFTELANTPVPKDKRLKRSDEADVRKLVDLLKPLANATLKFSAKTTPTIGDVIGLFEEVDEYFASVQASEDEEYVWKQAASRGHLINSKYYGFTEQADVYSMAILLHPNYRAAYMDVLKWPTDWQEQARKVLRETFVKHYEIKAEEADVAEGSQTQDFDKLDKTTQALMRRAKDMQRSAPARDAIGEWLAGLTPLQVGEKGDVVRIDPLQWWWSERQKGNV